MEQDTWWPGKLTVYVLPERNTFTNFIRRVEKRRLESEELGSFQVDNDTPHIAGGPGKTKGDPSAEEQVAQQAAAAILQRKAGPKVPLPSWLLDGFGRATLYRTTTGVASADRALVKKSVGMGKATKDIWSGSLTGPELLAMQASMAEYLTYGPWAAQISDFAGKFSAGRGGIPPGHRRSLRCCQGQSGPAGKELVGLGSEAALTKLARNSHKKHKKTQKKAN